MEPDTLLMTVQKGWQGNEVWNFLNDQRLIEELSWNDKKNYPRKRLLSQD